MFNYPIENVSLGIVTYKRKAYFVRLIKQIRKHYENKIKIIVFNNYLSDHKYLFTELKKIDRNILNLKSNIKNSVKKYIDYSPLDNLIPKIDSKTGGIILISNKENIGGAGGIGAIQYIFSKLKDYEYLWLVDDEMKINKNTLNELIKVAKQDKKIGIIGSTLLKINNKILEAGSALSRNDFQFLPRFHNYSLNKFKEKLKNDWEEVEYVSFASVLLTKQCVKKIGVFKNFFIHVDDAEYGYRARKNGFKVVVSYKSYALTQDVHKSSYSVYDLRNFLFLVKEHYSSIEKLKIVFSLMKKLFYSSIYNRKAFLIIKRSFSLYYNKQYGIYNEKFN